MTSDLFVAIALLMSAAGLVRWRDVVERWRGERRWNRYVNSELRRLDEHDARCRAEAE